ncbi:2-phosphosulfolactate phosphatase [Virgibacillus byunsanensis]|uniref:Probable 2-phosphosulfolactate phosphatase n=1 Tax=Virgibacillus byunsanensis TaxID=570945 RepID=A0ABW3LN59_9BACI
MRKVNVITQKELVDSSSISSCTAVVVDVFLATSTIAYLLENNYEPVYAVKDAKKALEAVKQQQGHFLLLGETNGELIEGFLYPDPSLIKPSEQEQAAIICSTNGTIGIENAKQAKVLYTSSLINGHRIAEVIDSQTDDSSIIIVCSGNAGRFSMEDFVGAGHLIDKLVRVGIYELSDSAKLARDAFQHAKSKSFNNLLDSETSHLLRDTGFENSIQWTIDHFEKVNAVPVFKRDKLINDFRKESF